MPAAPTPAQPLAAAIAPLPQADAGPALTAAIGDIVTLDGTRSTHAGGARLDYRWTLTAPAGSGARLSDPQAVRPHFSVDLLGDYVATLVVSDGSAHSTPASVRISTGNVAPVAHAGAGVTVGVGESVLLDAMDSHDANGDVLAYEWSVRHAPAGSRAVPAAPRVRSTSFTPDLEGDYVLAVAVSDGRLASEPASVRVSTRESRPIADAGNARRAVSGRSVHLDGRRSHDPDGAGLSYAWSVLHAPSPNAGRLSNASSATPGLEVGLPGLYVVQLLVSDGKYESVPATVVIDAHAPAAPIAGGPTRGPDTDGDGIADEFDNCVEDFNPDQRDTNGDGIGNLCDPDLDNDGFVTNFGDLLILKAAFFSTPADAEWNPDADFNGDDSVNFGDLLIMKNFFFGPPGPVAIVFSNPAGGSWHEPGNWNLGIVPDARYLVRIDLAPGMVVEYSTGDTDIRSLRTTSELRLSGGNLSVVGDAQFDGTFTLTGDGVFANANILPGTGPIVIEAANAPTMDAVTLGAEVTVENTATLTVVNGMNFDGGAVRLAGAGASTDLRIRGAAGATSTLEGAGEIVFDNSTVFDTVTEIEVFDSAHNLVIGSGITVRAGLSGGRLRHRVNNGTITMQGMVLSDLAGRRIELSGGPLVIEGVVEVTNGAEVSLPGGFSSTGTIFVTDGVLDIGDNEGDSWFNDGSISVGAAGTLELDGTFTVADAGTIVGTGTAIIEGVLDNTGLAFDRSVDLGLVNVLPGNGGELLGGSLINTPWTIPASVNFTLGGVLMGVDFTVDNSGILTIENGLTLDSVTVTLSSTGGNTDLRFRGANGETSMLGGTGEIVFGGMTVFDTTTEIEVFDSGHALVIGAGITVRTGSSGGRIRHRVNNAQITILGTVISNLAGRSVSLQGAPLVIDGSVIVSNGGEVALPTDWINNGSITITDGLLEIGDNESDSWNNNGTITLINATVELDGSFTIADIGSLSGTGLVIIEGVLDNTGLMLDLGADLTNADVSLGTGGVILGGTIVGTAVTIPASVNFTLDGVALSVDVTVENSGTLTVENNLTLNDVTITLASANAATDLRIRGPNGMTSTLGGTGEVVFGGTSVFDNVNEIEVFDSGHSLTIGPGITVQTGTTGGRIRHRVGNAQITLQGPVISNLATRVIRLQAGPTVIASTLDVLNGAELELAGDWSSTGTINVDNSVLDIGINVNDDWDNNGSIVMTNATVELDGTFTAADVGSLTGSGNVFIEGVLDNTGLTLDLATSLGTGNVIPGSGGTILGGTIDTTPLVIPASIVFTLDGVTLATDATISDAAVLSVENDLTLASATVTLASTNSSTDLRFRGANGSTSTLGGTGEVVFGGTTVFDTVNDIEVFDSGHALTIASGVTVRTSTTAGRVRHRVSNATITLQGDVVCDLSDHVLGLGGAPVVIEATVHAGRGCEVDFLNDYTIAASGAFDVDVGGTATSDFGRFTADGRNATLGGTLNIALVDGFSPTLGNTFEILTFDSRTGTFATENGTVIGGGLFFQVNYNATDVTLQVVN